MEVKEYMERDFQLLQKHVDDVMKAYDHQDPGKTMEKATTMFEAFSRRFGLEDFLLSKIVVKETMRKSLSDFLSRRRAVREKLEDMLMLHVSEPDFLKEVRNVLKECHHHVEFLQEVFYPEFLGALSGEEWEYLNTALEDRLHSTSF